MRVRRVTAAAESHVRAGRLVPQTRRLRGRRVATAAESDVRAGRVVPRTRRDDGGHLVDCGGWGGGAMLILDLAAMMTWVGRKVTPDSTTLQIRDGAREYRTGRENRPS